MQTQRLRFLDMARALAAIFMIFVHVLNLLALPEVDKSVFGDCINFLGSPPAAPVFMFAMGASFAVTLDLNRGVKFMRGFKIFAQGYFLNFLRLFCPFLLILFLGLFGFKAPFQGDSGSLKTELIDNLLVVDILQFAGLAYLFLSLVCFLRLNKTIFLSALILAICLISPMLWAIDTENIYLQRILDLFWGNRGEQVSFPFFPWICYPLLGLICGKRYKEAGKNYHQVLEKDIYWGVSLIIIGALLTIQNPAFHMGDYWRTGPGGMFMYLGFIPLWIFFCHLLTLYVPDIVQKISLFTSKHITLFYFIQWIFISSLVGVFGQNDEDLKMTILLMLVSLAITYIMTWLIVSCKRQRLPEK